jgi:hypothetical protein
MRHVLHQATLPPPSNWQIHGRPCCLALKQELTAHSEAKLASSWSGAKPWFVLWTLPARPSAQHTVKSWRRKWWRHQKNDNAVLWTGPPT